MAAAVCAGLLATAGMQAQTTWTVNNFIDAAVGTLETGGGYGPRNGPGNSGDLRYVLLGAMENGGANTVTFAGCSSSAPCKIMLGAALPPIFEATVNQAVYTGSFSLVIDGGAVASLVLTPTTLTAATAGAPYSQMLSASGGAASDTYTYAVTVGAVPAG